MILRTRQSEFVDKCFIALTEKNNTLGIAATGAGKTVMFSAVIKEFISSQPEFKACVLAHRDELVSQNQDKFTRVNPEISTSLINSVEKSWQGQINFAMVQTLSRDNNIDNMPRLDLLVVDEAHHIVADSYSKIINRAREINPNLKLFGVTATPSRGDNKGLGIYFDNCADIISINDLIDEGYLIKPKTFIIDINQLEQMEALKKQKDFNDEDVAKLLNTEPINDAVVEHWLEKARGRKTVVFCSTVEHARNVNDAFNSSGISSALITGELSKEERANILSSMTNGDIQVIVNVSVLTEGWDYPPISCVVLLRHNSYKSTMIQMIGRGLRIVDEREYPGIIKTDCIVLDFGLSCYLHGSLETEANLTKKGHKACKNCRKTIPASSAECIFCGFVFHVEEEKEAESNTENEIKKKEQIYSFAMCEIDMLTKQEVNALKKSKFSWVIFSENKMFSSGFNSWVYITGADDHFLVIGNQNKTSQTSLIYQGNRITALAKANDFLYENESNDTAKKTAAWKDLAPTEKQMEILSQILHINKKFKNYKMLDFNRGQVAQLFAYELNAKNKIKKLLQSTNNEEEE